MQIHLYIVTQLLSASNRAALDYFLICFQSMRAPELKDRLAQSENLMKEMTQTWEEKLRKTEEVHKVGLVSIVQQIDVGLPVGYSKSYQTFVCMCAYCLALEQEILILLLVYFQLRQETLEKMGLSLEKSGIKVEKTKCFLVNLNADPSLNELLVYYMKVSRPRR